MQGLGLGEPRCVSIALLWVPGLPEDQPDDKVHSLSAGEATGEYHPHGNSAASTQFRKIIVITAVTHFKIL